MTRPLRQLLTARYIYAGDGPRIENGTVEIVDGVIAAVHDKRDPAAEDLGDAAIIPGLVNAHTHLEFSDLTEPIGPADSFTDWIRGVVAYRRGRQNDDTEIIRRGLQESVVAGTTCLGEIATDDDFVARITNHGPSLTMFRELLGLLPEQADSQIEIARRFLDATEFTGTLQPALSPHAPYSVHPDLLKRIVDLACERDVPVAMHLAETQDELQLLKTGTGPFREMLEAFGVWRDGVLPTESRPMDALRELARAPRSLVIHGNYLAEDELDFLAATPTMSLVYCPRTHHYFGHERHPWQQVVERGGNVALGTDSRASNPDLSMWRELQFLASRHPECNDADLLRLGTINGAKALGLDDITGSLQPGKSAEVAVVRLNGNDADGRLFQVDATIDRTIIAGRWVE